MRVNIILFGQFREIIGKELTLDNIRDTAHLKAVLHEKYPAITGAGYLMAINKEIVTENTDLPENCAIAILPPFSGG
jgi:sulfur-carrier protein